MLVYLNGHFINEQKATVSANNRSFRYGDGCFETIKLMHGKVLQPQYHTGRLFASLAQLHFDCPSYFTPTYIIQRIEELAAKNQHQTLARIRVTVFRGDGGLYDPSNMRPNLLIQSWPLNEENNQLNSNGLVLDIYREGHKACDTLANIKSNNYLLYAMAAIAAKAQHCNDMLVLNQHGRIADSSIANLWLVEGDTLVTPALTEGPVSGTVRRYLLENAASKGFSANESAVTEERLLAADEVFLTNAIYGLKWVQRIGNQAYGSKWAAKIHAQLLQPLWQ